MYVYLLFFVSLLNISGTLFTAAEEKKPEREKRSVNFQRWSKKYGNKAANLKMLKNYSKKFKNIEVPDFFCIAHPEMIEFLSVKEEWKEIQKAWGDFQQSIKGQKGLPEESSKILSHLRSIVERVDYSDLYDILQDRGSISSRRSEKEKKFIEKAVEKKYLLMVRSTGREDGKELSNAGGNESIASVQPDRQAISKAIQKVLSSYFSEKSIMQRIIGKDENLLEGDPFVPVLMQYMIGEGSGESPNIIPRSGVMYSTEGEGNTPGLTIIQATWGHNEAVVNGLAPVDTYYIDNYLNIFPLIRKKYVRLKTVNGQLEKVSNEKYAHDGSSLVTASTLTRSHVIRLKRLANFLEKKDRHPVDIEFVIQRNTIYLVQVRPIEAKKLHPSYISSDFFNALDQNSVIGATMVGVGDAATHLISDYSQVIIADNIRTALKEYLSILAMHPERGEHVKAVIINEFAPATSHEANQFRGQEKPVFYLENLEGVNALLEQGVSLFADPQRGCIAPNRDGLDAGDVIKEGWFVHPISQLISLLSNFLDEVSIPHIEAIKKVESTVVPQLLQKIREADREEAINACDKLHNFVLQTIHFEMKDEGKRLGKEESVNTEFNTHLKNIARQFTVAIQAEKKVLRAEGAQQIQRLYPLTFITALLKQLPQKELVNQYSLGSLIKMNKKELEQVKALGIEDQPHREYLLQYAKADAHCLTPELGTLWKDFVKTISEDENQEFARMFYQINLLDMLPLWINVSFAKVVGQADAHHKLFQDFYESEAFLKNLAHIKKEFDAIKPEVFGDPAAFKKQWKRLSNLLEETVCSKDFIEDLTKSSQLGRLAALTVMQSIVETFDTSIKALTGSALYHQDDFHADRFRMMVEQYFRMFQQWASIGHIHHELQELCPKVGQYIETLISLEEYIQKMQELFEKSEQASNQFQASFNVTGAMLGSKSDWGRNFEAKNITLESIFSLIHQNLLVVIATLSKKENIKKTLMLPKGFKAFIDNIEKIEFAVEKKKSTSMFIGSFFKGSKLLLLYNVPIRQHSNTLVITYDIKTKKIIIEVTFIGHSEHQRWERIGAAVKALGKYFNIPLSKTVEVDAGIGLLSFAYQIERKEHLSLIPDIITIFSAWTLIQEDTLHLYGYLHEWISRFGMLREQDTSFKSYRINNRFIEDIYKLMKKDKDYVVLTLESGEFPDADPKAYLTKILEYTKKESLSSYENEVISLYISKIIAQYENDNTFRESDIQYFFEQFMSKRYPLYSALTFKGLYKDLYSAMSLKSLPMNYRTNILLFSYLFSYCKEQEKFLEFLITEDPGYASFLLSNIEDVNLLKKFKHIIEDTLFPAIYTDNATEKTMKHGLNLWKKCIEENIILTRDQSRDLFEKVMSMSPEQYNIHLFELAEFIVNEEREYLNDEAITWIADLLFTALYNDKDDKRYEDIFYYFRELINKAGHDFIVNKDYIIRLMDKDLGYASLFLSSIKNDVLLGGYSGGIKTLLLPAIYKEEATEETIKYGLDLWKLCIERKIVSTEESRNFFEEIMKMSEKQILEYIESLAQIVYEAKLYKSDDIQSWIVDKLIAKFENDTTGVHYNDILKVLPNFVTKTNIEHILNVLLKSKKTTYQVEWGEIVQKILLYEEKLPSEDVSNFFKFLSENFGIDINFYRLL